MKSIVVLGASDVKKPAKYGTVKNYEKWLNETAIITHKYFDNVFFIPDRGTYVDFARIFKELGGHTTAVKPTSNTPVRKEVLEHSDKVITMPGGSGWTYLNNHFVSLAPLALCLCYSAGSMLEICSSKYSMLYDKKYTSILVDERGVSSKLPEEIEAELFEVEYYSDKYQLEKLYEKHCN